MKKNILTSSKLIKQWITRVWNEKNWICWANKKLFEIELWKLRSLQYCVGIYKYEMNRLKIKSEQKKQKCCLFWVNNVWNVQMESRWSDTLLVLLFILFLCFDFNDICGNHFCKMRHIHTETKAQRWYMKLVQIRWVCSVIFELSQTMQKKNRRKKKKQRRPQTKHGTFHIIICNPYTNQNHKQHKDRINDSVQYVGWNRQKSNASRNRHTKK